ncbi:MAG: integrase, partial [Clostridia bacterium]
MNRITQEAKKRQAVVKLANRKGNSVSARMYSVSISSVKRWKARYDGTWQPLKERSHSPNNHPMRHNETE